MLLARCRSSLLLITGLTPPTPFILLQFQSMLQLFLYPSFALLHCLIIFLKFSFPFFPLMESIMSAVARRMPTHRCDSCDCCKILRQLFGHAIFVQRFLLINKQPSDIDSIIHYFHCICLFRNFQIYSNIAQLPLA